MSRLVLLSLVVVGCGRGVSSMSTTEPSPEPTPAPEPVASSSSSVFVSRFSPSQGIAGTTVRMVGSGFSSSMHLYFADLRSPEAKVLSLNEGLVEFEVPVGARSGPIVIAASDGLVTTQETFTVLTGPVVYGVEPSSWTIGGRDHVITISGDGFPAAPVVTLDGVVLSSPISSQTSIQAVIPYSLKLVAKEATVRVAGAATPLTVTMLNPAPSILSVSPEVLHSRIVDVLVDGVGIVRQTGGEFDSLTVVLIDGQPVPTSIVRGGVLAKLPSLMPGQHLVQLRNPPPGGGTSAPVTVTMQ